MTGRTKRKNYRFKSALLVDDSDLDNFINRKIMESVLFAENIQISTAAGEMLETLKKQDEIVSATFPEIIFIDLNMPVMDGFTFIEGLLRLKKVKEFRPQLVVLTSSVSLRDRERIAQIDPGILFLNKPLTAEMLNAV